jgi:hypothetical protein
MSTIPQLAKPQQAPYQAIAVSDIQRGKGAVIATFTLKIGGIFVRNVTLRRSRRGATYLNFPSYRNEHGRWVHLVEIRSQKLEDFIQQAAHKAISEVSHE